MVAHLFIRALSVASFGAGQPELQEFDELWPHRDEREVAAKLAQAAEAFSTSTHYEELWRAASWYVWVASDDLPSPDLQGAALLGRLAGERALDQNPAGVEAKYWTALSVGLYASMANPFEAMSIGIDKHFRAPLQAVLQADPTRDNPHLEYVGAEIALGALYQHLPWPNQDRRRALELFERAVRAHPENLRAHYMLGDFWRDADPTVARRELMLVRDGDDSYDPPDARRQKRKAALLLKTIR